jgi:threonylcarbamoyladenosine tRNA methylthiotransferase MtaB
VIDRKTVAFHTFGCKVNQYESEELRAQLRLGGFDIVPMEDAADVYIINSCTVTADADSSCRQTVRKILRERPQARVVVTGCYAERAPAELRELSDRVETFGNHEKPLIAATLGVPTACVEAAARPGVTALAERTRVFVKIQDGCDAHCTYCIIPSVRPTLICRAPELILQEVNALIAKGFREIVLTGVRLGRYEGRGGALSPPESTSPGGHGGPPLQWSFSDLLKAILDLPGDFRIRLSSIEVTELPDDVIEWAANHPKMCPFFHIPMQSGDDDVLKRMGRWYDAATYRDRIRYIRARVPNVALSADVICGFPGETEDQFQRTQSLLSEEGFSRVHAFRYSVRPGTPAERLPNHVDPGTKAERTRRMNRLDMALRSNFAARFIGQRMRVLVEDRGEGYSERYVRVKAPAGSPEGQFIEVSGESLSGSLLTTTTL